MLSKNKIYVAFVNAPNDYLTNHSANAAISHFIYHAIKKKYGDMVISALWTNDLPIERWNNNHLQVAEKKKWLEDNAGRVILTQPPLDKEYLIRLYDPNIQFNELKMLVYHDGWRKNGQHLIDLLNRHGYQSKFDV